MSSLVSVAVYSQRIDDEKLAANIRVIAEALARHVYNISPQGAFSLFTDAMVCVLLFVLCVCVRAHVCVGVRARVCVCVCVTVFEIECCFISPWILCVQCVAPSFHCLCILFTDAMAGVFVHISVCVCVHACVHVCADMDACILQD